MNRTELLELITNGENSRVEFTRDDVRPDSLAQEISALLNLEGGVILLGVENDGRISGLTRSREAAEEWVMNVARQNLQPAVIPVWSSVAMEDGNVDFVRRNMGSVAWLEGGRRRRKKSLPLDAVREAVVNAVAHRDYAREGTDIEVSLYRDRLEVISPGRLPNGVTVEKMKEGVVRVARNELLKEILRDYGYIEHYGMGVRNRIIQAMRAHNRTDPDLIEEEDRFVVRLWKERRQS
jgi:ATP-dependent DNA helicase RecG